MEERREGRKPTTLGSQETKRDRVGLEKDVQNKCQPERLATISHVDMEGISTEVITQQLSIMPNIRSVR